MFRTTAAQAVMFVLLLVLVACEGEGTGSDSLPADGDGGFAERSEGEHVNEGLGTEEAGIEAGSGQVGAEGRYTGTLARGEGDEGCIVLETAEEQLELLAGEGVEVRADLDTGDLTGTDDQIIAQVGDEITVDGEVDSSMETGCGGDQVLVISALSGDDGQ